jgi:nucleotide-binding universal stress UspA family protein
MKRRSEEVGEMSIFPTKILLATDGSEEAELALLTAVALAKSTDSELHVLTAMPDLPDLDADKKLPARLSLSILEA